MAICVLLRNYLLTGFSVVQNANLISSECWRRFWLCNVDWSGASCWSRWYWATCVICWLAVVSVTLSDPECLFIYIHCNMESQEGNTWCMTCIYIVTSLISSCGCPCLELSAVLHQRCTLTGLFDSSWRQCCSGHNSNNNNNNNPLYSFVDKPLRYASQQLTCRTALINHYWHAGQVQPTTTGFSTGISCQHKRR